MRDGELEMVGTDLLTSMPLATWLPLPTLSFERARMLSILSFLHPNARKGGLSQDRSIS